jgi:hypothetical protein
VLLRQLLLEYGDLLLPFLEPLFVLFGRGELVPHLAFLPPPATASIVRTTPVAELCRLLLGRLLAAPEFGNAVLALAGRTDRLWRNPAISHSLNLSLPRSLESCHCVSLFFLRS